MRYSNIPLVFLVFLTISLQISPALAKEVFKDEAGEVLYTVDDDGLVSMFENSPGTDVTLSVVRGTREQMQPQITEISPDSIPAGSYNVLRLTGKNLVGAKVKLSVPALEVGSYSGKPKRLRRAMSPWKLRPLSAARKRSLRSPRSNSEAADLRRPEAIASRIQDSVMEPMKAPDRSLLPLLPPAPRE